MGSRANTVGALRVLAVCLAGLLLAGPARAQPSPSAPVDVLLREAQKAAETGDHRAAERYFARALATDPRSPEAACGLGQARMALSQFPDAVVALETCRGLVLERLRRLSSEQTASYARADQEIRELYETMGAIRSGRAMQSDPGLLDRIEGRIRELESLKTRERIRVEVPAPISLALGQAYLKTGAFESAEEALLDALRSGGGAREAHAHLAGVYVAQGRFEEAAEQLGLAEAAGAPVDPRLKADIEARRSPLLAPPTPAASAPAARTTKEGLSIRHEGRSCAVSGLFVRLEATVTPSWGIHDPIVRFRSEDAAGWYAMTMLPSGGDTFAAVLPKPRGTASFDYFIEASAYDDQQTRTDDFRVTVIRKREECAESSGDTSEPGSVLIVDKPRDVADAPAVPSGFSIRGTTADIGVLEIGSNKALIAGGIALAGAAAAGIAVASKPAEPYSGPEPFVDGPGIAFVSSNPPPGSTLSLSAGSLSVELRVYSLETMMGARITAHLSQANNRYSSCIILNTTQDLAAVRMESVVMSGPTQSGGDYCNLSAPADIIRVMVVPSSGPGGFRTGTPSLPHLPVFYELTE